MASRIAEGGFPVVLWARRPESLAAFRDTGARIASTPAELGAASEIVGICVVADTDVEEVLLGDDGVLAGMAPGGIVAIHSTVHPETCKRLAAPAAERGVAVVDAPVSGGGQAAAAGKLLVMAGGSDADVARCRPVFESYADPVLHLGPLGSGQIAKVLNNLVFTAQLALALDTYGLASRLGVDRSGFAEVLGHGSGGSRAASILGSSGFDLTGIRHAADLLRKDVGILRDVARARDVSEPESLLRLAESALGTLSK